MPRRGQGDRSKARLTHRRNDGLSSSILPTSSTTNTVLPPPLAEPTCRRGKGHDLQQVIGDLVTLLGGVALAYGAEKGEGQLLEGRQVHHIRAHCARPSALRWTGHVPGNTNRVKTWLRGGAGLTGLPAAGQRCPRSSHCDHIKADPAGALSDLLRVEAFHFHPGGPQRFTGLLDQGGLPNTWTHGNDAADLIVTRLVGLTGWLVLVSAG